MTAGKLWIAEFETRSTHSRGFGSTPEEALSALVELWRAEWSPMSGADPEYPVEYRGDIAISAFEPGKAYLIGSGDALWHREVLNGSDSRFDLFFAPSQSALSQ